MQSRQQQYFFVELEPVVRFSEQSRSGLGFCNFGPKLTCETHFLGLLGSVSDSVRGLGHAASLRVMSVSMAVFIQFNVSWVALLGKTCNTDHM